MTYTIKFDDRTVKFETLENADLRCANLRGADLRCADLRYADLNDADLRCADLRCADLKSANLRGANLRGANIDFTNLPLWCGGLGLKTDAGQMAQLAYHFCSMICNDPMVRDMQNALMDLANTSHVIKVHDCPVLEKKTEKRSKKG